MMERPRSLKPWGGSPKHSGPTWRTAIGLLVLAAVLSLLLEGWWILSVPETLRATSRVVEVPAHKGVVEVAEILDDAGVIRSRVGFILLSVARGSFRSLKAGEYQIPQGTNTVRVLERLEGGQVLQHMVVVQEGSTLPPLAKQLETEPLAPPPGTLPAAREAVFLKTLPPPRTPAHGHPLPS